MTDLPNSAADPVANTSTPDGETPAGDPELAALVARTTPVRRPELAALVAPTRRRTTPTTSRRDPPTPSPASMPYRSCPLAAAVTDDEPPARPRRRRSLVLRFGVSFVLGVLLAVGVGAGVLYAWGQQYDARVLPGVRVGSTELGGLTREQAEAAIATAYGSLGTGQITLNGPDGPATISYADVGRGPDTAALIDEALEAGRQGELFVNLLASPQAAINGVTLEPAVTYDRDKLTAAIETLARRSTRPPSTPPCRPARAGRQRLPVEGGARRRQGGPGRGPRPAARGARRAGVDHGARAGRAVGTRRRDRLGRGGKGGRGPDGRQRGRRPGRGQLDDRGQEHRAADLVLDRGRRTGHPGRRLVGTRPDAHDAGQEGQPDPAGREASSWSADTSWRPARAARAGRSTSTA